MTGTRPPQVGRTSQVAHELRALRRHRLAPAVWPMFHNKTLRTLRRTRQSAWRHVSGQPKGDGRNSPPYSRSGRVIRWGILFAL